MLFVFFHGGVPLRRESWRESLCLVPDVDGLFDVLLGDRVAAEDAAVEGLMEFEVLPVRSLSVHNADRVVVRLQIFVNRVRAFKNLVRGG